ncbi:MAG: hypothetical protein LUQ66_05205 [Methanoregula sp.]|nr:hypothetical protein [Methanoregula sp.]
MSTIGVYEIPLTAQILYRRGIILSNQMKEEEAVKSFRQAVLIAPRFAGAYREMGICLTRLGRVEDAAACYQKLERVEPIRIGYTNPCWKES